MKLSIIDKSDSVKEFDDSVMTSSSCSYSLSEGCRVQITFGCIQLDLTLSEARDLRDVISEEINELMSEEED